MPPKFSRKLEEKIIFPEHIVNQVRTSPCEANCPAGNPIQRMNSLIQEGRIEGALAYLKSRNPFPGITGRVCAHPCENVCNRNDYDEGLAIRSLERFAAEHADATLVKGPRRREKTGKNLAIIGAGPAGMTCAYFSALLGHEVTVFEASATLGGIPRTAIPDFSLPKYVVDREIGRVLELGVRTQTNTAIGRDIAFEDILTEYDACLIAIGSNKDRRLDIPNIDLVIPALSFLKQINLGQQMSVGDEVIIIGGGGVAFDCALTVKRLGATKVQVVCVEGPDCMCAPSHQISQAEAHGITIHNSTMVSGILESKGKAAGIECFEISAFEFDENIRLSVEPGSGEKKTMTADTLISAVGVEPDLTFIKEYSQLELSAGITLKADPKTMATSVAGVFAAGDVVSGPSSVAQAIGSGRRAAVAIDSFFNSGRNEDTKQIVIDDTCQIVKQENIHKSAPHVVEYEEIWNVSYHEKKKRQVTATLSPEKAIRSFEEVDKGFEKEAAVAEAERCLHCGHCTSCGCCVEDCPGIILEMGQDGPLVAYPNECWHCGCCRIACPSGAILYEFPLTMLV